MSIAWKRRREAGSSAGIAAVKWVALMLGRDAVQILLYPVAAYFAATRTMERRASRNFLQRILGRRPSCRETVAHFHTFATVATDRLYLLGGRGRKVQTTVYGQEQVTGVIREKRGCIVLSSHLGSFEATRAASFDDGQVDVFMVIDRELNPNYTRHLEAVAPDLARRVVDASGPPAGVALRVAELLATGAWVGIPADRQVPGAPVIECDFLGAPCTLPAGPFTLATVLQAPVIMATGLYYDGGYHLYFDRLSVEPPTTRDERKASANRLARRFVHRLEQYARICPYNWFNFYEFWKSA